MNTDYSNLNLATSESLVETAEKMPNGMLRKVLQEIAYEKSVQDEAGIRNPCKHLETAFSNVSFSRSSARLKSFQ